MIDHAPHNKGLWLPAGYSGKAKPIGTGKPGECRCGARGQVMEFHARGYRFNWVEGCRCDTTQRFLREHEIKG